MNLPLLIVLTTLAFFGFSDSAFAQKECQDPDPRPRCNPGGGGDDHGDPPAQYCVELISGGFDFPGRVTVTRNNRGNEYNSPEGVYGAEGLYMDRPPDDADAFAWDAVFTIETCPVLTLDGNITEIYVSDKWAISNPAKDAGTAGTTIIVSLKNAYSTLYPEIEFDLHLVGKLPDPCANEPCIPEEFEDYVVIELDEFRFYVHAHGTDSCRILSRFADENADSSRLKMIRGTCEELGP